MGIMIRPAAAADVAQILAFIRALAVYERAPDAVSATEEASCAMALAPTRFIPA